MTAFAKEFKFEAAATCHRGRREKAAGAPIHRAHRRRKSHPLPLYRRKQQNSMSRSDLTTDDGYQSLLGKISNIYATDQARASQAVS